MATGTSNLSDRVVEEVTACEDENASTTTSLTQKARFDDHTAEKSGWIELGQNPGQVKVQVKPNEDKLKLQNDTEGKSGSNFCFGKTKGPHIFMLSLIFIPCALISSLGMSFYLGTLTWYNCIVYFSEDRTICHKIFLCPILILTFPFTIWLSSLGIALYSCVAQISWFASSWCAKLRDPEKGFYGGFCDLVGLPQCAPYNIIDLTESGEIEVQA